jgi:hypothetical protein
MSFKTVINSLESIYTLFKKLSKIQKILIQNVRLSFNHTIIQLILIVENEIDDVSNGIIYSL